jgi:hypothetical protein
LLKKLAKVTLAERVGDFRADSRKSNVCAAFVCNRLRAQDLPAGRRCALFSSFGLCCLIFFLQWHSKWCSTRVVRSSVCERYSRIHFRRYLASGIAPEDRDLAASGTARGVRPHRTGTFLLSSVNQLRTTTIRSPAPTGAVFLTMRNRPSGATSQAGP